MKEWNSLLYFCSFRSENYRF